MSAEIPRQPIRVNVELPTGQTRFAAQIRTFEPLTDDNSKGTGLILHAEVKPRQPGQIRCVTVLLQLIALERFDKSPDQTVSRLRPPVPPLHLFRHTAPGAVGGVALYVTADLRPEGSMHTQPNRRCSSEWRLTSRQTP